MGFKAQAAVTKLDWDFRPFVDATGTSPEPSGDAIGDYWSDYMSALRESQQNIQDFQDRRNETKDSEERKAIDVQFDAYQKKHAKEMLSVRIDLLAKLLDNVPSSSQMHGLPGRIFDAYELAVQEELSPKGLTNDTNS
jgi:hypothetical protein